MRTTRTDHACRPRVRDILRTMRAGRAGINITSTIDGIFQESSIGRAGARPPMLVIIIIIIIINRTLNNIINRKT